MQTSTNNTQSKTDSTQEASQTTEAQTGYKTPDSIPKPESQQTPEPEADSGKDEYGYDKIPEPESKEPEQTPEVKEEDTKVDKPATGYGEKDEPEPKKEEKDGPASKEEDEKPEEEKEKSQKEIQEAVKGLPDNFDKDKVAKFASDNNFSKEQIESYVELVKAEEAEVAKSQEKAIQKQRSEWKEELMNDTDFGGENFDKNVDRVEKVLQNHFPSTKKVLTERGSMLPPYIMKDFLALSKVLNPTTPLVGGEPSQPKENDSGNFLDEMYK